MITTGVPGHIIVRLDNPVWADVPFKIKQDFQGAIAELQHAHCDFCTFNSYEGDRGKVVLSVPIGAAYMVGHAIRIALIFSKEAKLWHERKGDK